MALKKQSIRSNQIITVNGETIPKEELIARSEEWSEIIHHVAHEVRYEVSDNLILKMREGLFLEASAKGGRKYFSFAPGIELYGFRLGYSRWLAFGQNTNLSGTHSFSIGFHRKFGYKWRSLN